MRKIVLMMSVSLDGYFEGPDHDISWHLVDEELHQHMNDLTRRMSGDLCGRVTFELMDGYWPTADAAPDVTPVEAEFAQLWRDLPKYVFSRTLEHVDDPNATIVRELVPEEIRKLKAQPGGDLVVGGAVLATEFLRHGLVDELRIYVHPVLVGRGRRLFASADTLTSLDLVETHTFRNGVVLLRYEVPAVGGTKS
ncbi:dihydrofolate reductase family protein [Streptomyces griseorubiginosus]|uniref:dihydrofolate reductase family protein n=1 Tax=Streptomyces griseorubiginosus TaxID=67304 RepID=UPI003629B027